MGTRDRWHRRWIRSAAVAALALAATSCQSQAPQPAGSELKLSVAVAPAFPLGAAARAWAEAMAAASAARIDAKVHPGAALALRDPGREFFALRDGAADLAVGSALAWSTQFPAGGVYALPWIAPEPDDLAELVAAPEVAAIVMKRAVDVGVVIVAMAPLGHRALATVDRVVRTPTDLAGLRLRVTGGASVAETLAALGARPEAMSFLQAQEALATGKLDGQDGMATSFVAARFPATGYRQLAHLGAFGDAMLFAVRRPVWDAWTDAQRASAVATARAVAREGGAQKREAAAERELVAAGMGETRLTRAGVDAFSAAAAQVRAMRGQFVGADLVSAAEAAVARFRESRTPPGPAATPQ